MSIVLKIHFIFALGLLLGTLEAFSQACSMTEDELLATFDRQLEEHDPEITATIEKLSEIKSQTSIGRLLENIDLGIDAFRPQKTFLRMSGLNSIPDGFYSKYYPAYKAAKNIGVTTDACIGAIEATDESNRDRLQILAELGLQTKRQSFVEKIVKRARSDIDGGKWKYLEIRCISAVTSCDETTWPLLMKMQFCNWGIRVSVSNLLSQTLAVPMKTSDAFVANALYVLPDKAAVGSSMEFRMLYDTSLNVIDSNQNIAPGKQATYFVPWKAIQAHKAENIGGKMLRAYWHLSDETRHTFASNMQNVCFDTDPVLLALSVSRERMEAPKLGLGLVLHDENLDNADVAFLVENGTDEAFAFSAHQKERSMLVFVSHGTRYETEMSIEQLWEIGPTIPAGGAREHDIALRDILAKCPESVRASFRVNGDLDIYWKCGDMDSTPLSLWLGECK